MFIPLTTCLSFITEEKYPSVKILQKAKNGFTFEKIEIKIQLWRKLITHLFTREWGRSQYIGNQYMIS